MMAWLRRVGRRVLDARPSMYSKSVILNVLGFQLVRTLFFELRRTFRPRKSIEAEYAGYLRELEKTGLVIIPNYFADGVHKQILEEYEALAPQFVPSLSAVMLPHVDRMSIHDERISPYVRNLFVENTFFKSMATAFLNRTYHLPVQGFLTKIYCREEELALPKNGGTNNIHFDVPTRTLKFFYYLTDTDVAQGPFYYARGTQRRNSWKRLFFEYKLSIRYARNKWNPAHGGEYADDEPWVKMTQEELRREGIDVKPITAKANTLVIANTGGYHQRGEFLKAGVRKTVEVNYRAIETPRNGANYLKEKLQRLEAPALSPQVGYQS